MSKRFRFNRDDLKKWSKNLLVFVSVPAITYLVFVNANLANGFSWSDFIPNEIVLGTIWGYFVSSAIDFFKKLISN